MSLSNTCNVSSDCLDVFDDDVVRHCFETAGFSSKTNFCDCSTWYGWTGDSCDEETTRLVLQRYTTLALLVISVIMLFVSVRTLVLNHIMEVKRDALFFTLLFTVLGILSFAINVSFRLKPLIDPTAFHIRTFKTIALGDFENVGGGSGNHGSYFLVLATSCESLSSLCLILSWDIVLSKVSRFQSQDRQNSVKKWTLRLKIFSFVYFSGLIVFLSLGFLYEAFFLIALVSFGVTVFFVGASCRFLRTFKELQNGSIAVSLTNRLVYKISIITSICRIFVIIGSVGFFLASNGIEERLKEDEINYGNIFRDLAAVSSLLLVLTTTWYVNSVTEGAIYADAYPRLCWIFKLWDLKNTQMLIDFGDNDDLKRSISENKDIDTNINTKVVLKDKNSNKVYELGQII